MPRQNTGSNLSGSGFTDILGLLKSVAIPVEQLDSALTEGIGFDGSAVEGFARMDESDMIAMPDPNTFQVLPFRPQEGGTVARMFCDILQPGENHIVETRAGC